MVIVNGHNWRLLGRRFSSNVLEAWRSGSRATLDLLFPHVCVLCNEPLSDDSSNSPPFCPACTAALPPITSRSCQRCGSPLALSAIDNTACAACRTRRFAFDAAVAYGVYRGGLRDAVVKAKQAAHEPLATALGGLLAASCQARWPTPAFDMIMPAPMHWQRRWRRGVNSAELLCEAVARQLKLPMRKLIRVQRATAKQGMLTPHERFENVRGAFRFRGHRSLVRGRRILLIDDVMTTGATASEAAKVLRRAGADSVCVAVVARGTGQ